MGKYFYIKSLHCECFNITGYADDTTVHVNEKNLTDIIAKLEILAKNMIQYCNENELIINAKKTQILTLAKQDIKVRIGQDMITSSRKISLLGLEYEICKVSWVWLKN